MAEPESPDLFELTAAAEEARAGAQIDEHGPLGALPASWRRHDVLMRATEAAVRAQGGPSAACRKGCAWCCQFRVAVRVDEAIVLGAWVREHLPAERVAEILQRARDNAAVLRRKSPELRMRTNLACPLLEDRACVAYEARPHTCRAFHAIDVEGCEASVVDPERDDIPEARIPEVMVVSAGHDEGLLRALETRGHDVEVYELNEALLRVLGEADLVERWARGEAVMRGAEFV